MKRRYTMAMGLAAAALISTLAACSDYGFFSTLSGETSSAKTSTFKRARITDVVYFKGDYYALAAAVYKQSASSTGLADPAVWELLTPGLEHYAPTAATSTNETAETYSCKAIAADSSYIYLSAVKESNKTAEIQYALYCSSTGAGTKEAWSEVTIPVPASAKFYGTQALYSLNGKVFAAVRVSESLSVSTYRLYSLSGTDATEISVTKDKEALFSLPVAAYMNDEYWFSALASSGASYSTLYHASDPTFAGMTTSPCPAKIVISAMAQGPSSTMAFGTTGGYVYLENSSLGFSTKDENYWRLPYSASYGIRSLIALPKDNPTVLLAACGYPNGYYVSNVSSGKLGKFWAQDNSSSDKLISSIANFDSTLDSLLVEKFVYDDPNSRLFACVSATATSATTKFSGLYSNDFKNSAWMGWKTE